MINIPITENAIPNQKTIFNEKWPVTVGRSWVRIISLSKSTSYQLLSINAPDITNKLPIVTKTNSSQRIIKSAPVKCNASQYPTMTGNTLAINTIPFTILLKSKNSCLYDDLSLLFSATLFKLDHFSFFTLYH